MVCHILRIRCGSRYSAEYSRCPAVFVYLAKPGPPCDCALLNWHRDHSSQLFKLSRRGSITWRVALGAYRNGKFISYYEDCLGDCSCSFILSVYKACRSGICDSNRSGIKLFPAISSPNC